MLSEISGTPFSGGREGYPQEHQVCPLFTNFDPNPELQLERRHMLPES